MTQGDIVSNKRLGAILAKIQADQRTQDERFLASTHRTLREKQRIRNGPSAGGCTAGQPIASGLPDIATLRRTRHFYFALTSTAPTAPIVRDSCRLQRFWTGRPTREGVPPAQSRESSAYLGCRPRHPSGSRPVCERSRNEPGRSCRGRPRLDTGYTSAQDHRASNVTRTQAWLTTRRGHVRSETVVSVSAKRARTIDSSREFRRAEPVSRRTCPCLATIGGPSPADLLDTSLCMTAIWCDRGSASLRSGLRVKKTEGGVPYTDDSRWPSLSFLVFR